MVADIYVWVVAEYLYIEEVSEGEVNVNHLDAWNKQIDSFNKLWE